MFMIKEEAVSANIAHIVKESACNAGDWRSSLEDPLERKWQPIPVLLPGEFHGQRSLASSSPWGGKESD